MEQGTESQRRGEGRRRGTRERERPLAQEAVPRDPSHATGDAYLARAGLKSQSAPAHMLRVIRFHVFTYALLVRFCVEY